MAEQTVLQEAKVAVVGCGGLGGYALEQLARLGVGHLTAVDGDVFDLSNLNRQLFATARTIGCNKALAARDRLEEVNSLVVVTPYPRQITTENAKEVLAGSQVVVDALDNLPSRLLLQAVCGNLQIPMVHGAIAGWYGQLAVIRPGQPMLSRLNLHAGREGVATKTGIESKSGNPAFAPGLVASLQVAEVTKLLLGRKSPMDSHFLWIDLLEMEFLLIPMTAPDP